jgi:uncharacterized RDD family membrane protein YckC
MSEINLRGAYAGFVTRAAAFILDLIFVSLSIGVVNGLFRLLLWYFDLDPAACPPIRLGNFLRASTCHASAWLMLILSIAFPFLYLLFFWMLSGQTPGKFFLRLRIIRQDGGRVRLHQSLRRLLGYWLAILTLGIGFLYVLVDDRRRGLHDRLAGTCVIYDWDARVDAGFLEQVSRKINLRWDPPQVSGDDRRRTQGLLDATE